MIKDVPITADKFGNTVQMSVAGKDVKVRIMLLDGSIGFASTVRPDDPLSIQVSDEKGLKGQVQAYSDRWGWIKVTDL